VPNQPFLFEPRQRRVDRADRDVAPGPVGDLPPDRDAVRLGRQAGQRQESRYGYDPIMNIEHYKQRLLDLEKTLSASIDRETDEGRREFIDSAHDVGDASVADEVASEDFTEAERNADQLKQVRDALGRIADGTFGACIVDGGPIEEQRLEALPWTPYCLKHAERLEARASSRTPTL
jgi:DnaK suppressor protein